MVKPQGDLGEEPEDGAGEGLVGIHLRELLRGLPHKRGQRLEDTRELDGVEGLEGDGDCGDE